MKLLQTQLDNRKTAIKMYLIQQYNIVKQKPLYWLFSFMER